MRLAAKHIPDLKSSDVDNLKDFATQLEIRDIKTFVDASAFFAFGGPVGEDTE